MVVIACSAATTYAANKKSSAPGTTTANLNSSPRKIKAQDVKGTLVVRLASGEVKPSVSMKKTAVKTAARPVRAASVSKVSSSKANLSKVNLSSVQKDPGPKRWVEQKKIPMVAVSKKKEQLALNLRKPLQKFRKQLSIPVRAPVVRSAVPSEEARADSALPLSDVNESTAKNILQTAFHYLKTAYRIGGSGPAGFDCSGFTSFIFRKHGISLPRSSVDQAQEGKVVAQHELKPGDLVFFSTFRKGISHVGIFIANGLFIHSAGRGKGVSLDNIFSQYWASRYRTARRVDLTGADQIAAADDTAPFAG